jgi:hypothetical protein
MAAIGVQHALSSCRALHRSVQRPGTNERLPAACNASVPLCCRKQGVILSRSSQSGKAILLAKGTRGRLSALQSIAAWEGKQHLGAATSEVLYGENTIRNGPLSFFYAVLPSGSFRLRHNGFLWSSLYLSILALVRFLLKELQRLRAW